MGKSATIIKSFISENFLSIVFSILFLFFLIFAANYSILSADDFYSVFSTKENSLASLLKLVHQSWSFRFVAIIVNYLFCLTVNESYSLITFHLTSFLIIFSCSFYIIKNLLKKENSFQLFIFAIISSSVFYFSSHSINETVFWMASATSYLYAIPIFLAGLLFVILNKFSVLKSLVIVLVFFIAGGFSEVYCASFIILLLFLLVYKITLKQNYGLLLIAIIACVTSFYINYSAPGNEARASFLPSPSILTSFVIGTKTIIKIFSINLKFHQLISLLISVVLFIKIRGLNPQVLQNKRTITLFLLGLATIPIYICAYILSDAPPARMLLISELSFILILAIYLSNFKLNNIYLLTLASVLLIVFIAVNYKNTINYHNSIKQQLITLKKLNNKKFSEIYVWKNQTNSGLIYPTIIDADSNYFTNQHVKQFLHLKFNIVSKN
ncbi:MAG: DUF6056 family protein [Bacteroidota bacterium]